MTAGPARLILGYRANPSSTPEAQHRIAEKDAWKPGQHTSALETVLVGFESQDPATTATANNLDRESPVAAAQQPLDPDGAGVSSTRARPGFRVFLESIAAGRFMVTLITAPGSTRR